MGKRRKRRTWSHDEKREICAQAIAPGVSVAQVARRYALNANMIHNWLKDVRFSPTSGRSDGLDQGPSFLELDVTDYTGSGSDRSVPAIMGVGGAVCATRIDLTLSDGRRILIEGPMSLPAIVQLVEGLAA